MSRYEFTEGHTTAIRIALLTEKEVPAGNMSGMTAVLILTDHLNVALTLTGTTVIADVDNWYVDFTPAAADYVHGSYFGRVKVTDTAGNVQYFPEGKWDDWIIRKK